MALDGNQFTSRENHDEILRCAARIYGIHMALLPLAGTLIGMNDAQADYLGDLKRESSDLQARVRALGGFSEWHQSTLGDYVPRVGLFEEGVGRKEVSYGYGTTCKREIEDQIRRLASVR